MAWRCSGTGNAELAAAASFGETERAERDEQLVSHRVYQLIPLSIYIATNTQNTDRAT